MTVIKNTQTFFFSVSLWCMDGWHATAVKKASRDCPGDKALCLGDIADAGRVKGCDNFRGPMLEKNSSRIILLREVGVQSPSGVGGGYNSRLCHCKYVAPLTKLGHPETTDLSPLHCFVTVKVNWLQTLLLLKWIFTCGGEPPFLHSSCHCRLRG